MPPRLHLLSPFLRISSPRVSGLPCRLPLFPNTAPLLCRNYAKSSDDTGPLFDERCPTNDDMILLVDEEGANLGLKNLRTLLRQIPRHTHMIQCVAPQEEFPVCRVVSKEAIEAARIAAIRDKKAKRKENSGKDPSKTVKEVELSWAISENDLGHRLKKCEQFLKKGFRVEVTLGTRKGMRKMLVEEIRELAGRVDSELAKWGREMKDPEGEVGKKLTLFYEGKRVPVEKKAKFKRGGEEAEEEVERKE